MITTCDIFPTLPSAAAAAKSLLPCPILWDRIDGSPPGCAIPGILQARTLEWGAIAFFIPLALTPHFRGLSYCLGSAMPIKRQYINNNKFITINNVSSPQEFIYLKTPVGDFPGGTVDGREGNDTLLQYSCLENPMDGRAWKAAVHGVAKSRT